MPGPMKMLSLLALVLGAIALGACGGADEREANNAYVRQLNAAQEQFANDASAVSQRKSAAGISQYRRTLRRFESTIETFADELRKIEVPRVVRDDHAQLIDAIAGFGNDIRQATKTLGNRNPRAVEGARGAIQTAQQTANVRIDAALEAIKSKLAAA